MTSTYKLAAGLEMIILFLSLSVYAQSASPKLNKFSVMYSTQRLWPYRNLGGTVTVRVIIDEQGNVSAARVLDGHNLLRAVCLAAARQAKFSPTFLEGEPVKVTGVIVYNFVRARR